MFIHGLAISHQPEFRVGQMRPGFEGCDPVHYTNWILLLPTPRKLLLPSLLVYRTCLFKTFQDQRKWRTENCAQRGCKHSMCLLSQNGGSGYFQTHCAAQKIRLCCSMRSIARSAATPPHFSLDTSRSNSSTAPQPQPGVVNPVHKLQLYAGIPTSL